MRSTRCSPPSRSSRDIRDLAEPHLRDRGRHLCPHTDATLEPEVVDRHGSIAVGRAHIERRATAAVDADVRSLADEVQHLASLIDLNAGVANVEGGQDADRRSRFLD